MPQVKLIFIPATDDLTMENCIPDLQQGVGNISKMRIGKNEQVLDEVELGPLTKVLRVCLQ